MNFDFAGAGIGGMNGLYNGLIETKAAQLTGAVRRTQYVSLIHVYFLSWLQILSVLLFVKHFQLLAPPKVSLWQFVRPHPVFSDHRKIDWLLVIQGPRICVYDALCDYVNDTQNCLLSLSVSQCSTAFCQCTLPSFIVLLIFAENVVSSVILHIFLYYRDSRMFQSVLLDLLLDQWRSLYIWLLI